MIKTTHQKYKELVSRIMEDIADRRKKLGMSYDKLSILTGLSRPHLSRVERGIHTTTLLSLLKICNALDISLVELIKKHEKN
jgi:transcriptional regulator with XRE-family HTH domain